jgi:hypothetical protein
MTQASTSKAVERMIPPLIVLSPYHFSQVGRTPPDCIDSAVLTALPFVVKSSMTAVERRHKEGVS